MSTAATIPVIDPDGKLAYAPQDRMPEVLQNGFKMATAITDPDNKLAYVPSDRAGDVIKQPGFKLGPPEQQKFNNTQGSGIGESGIDPFLSAAGSKISEAASSTGHVLKVGGKTLLKMALNPTPAGISQALAEEAAEQQTNGGIPNSKDIVSAPFKELTGERQPGESATLGFTGHDPSQQPLLTRTATSMSSLMGGDPAAARSSFSQAATFLDQNNPELANLRNQQGVADLTAVPLATVGTGRLLGAEGVRGALARTAQEVAASAPDSQTIINAGRATLKGLDRGTDVLADTLIDPRKAFTETLPRAAGGTVRNLFKKSEAAAAPMAPPAPPLQLGQGPVIMPPPADTSGSIPYTPPPFSNTTRAQRLGLMLPAAPSDPIPMPAVPVAPEPEGLFPAASQVVYDPQTGTSKVQFLTSPAEPGATMTPRDSQLLNDPRGALSRFVQEDQMGGLADPLDTHPGSSLRKRATPEARRGAVSTDEAPAPTVQPRPFWKPTRDFLSPEAAALDDIGTRNVGQLKTIATQRGIPFDGSLPPDELHTQLAHAIVEDMTAKDDPALDEFGAQSIERSRSKRIGIMPTAEEAAAQKPAPTESKAPQPTTPERRKNVDYRAAVDAMKPEDQAKAIFFSDKTKLPNYRAFQQSGDLLSQTHSHIGYADVDDFKSANTALGHEAVDAKVLPMIGDAFRDAAQDEPGVHVFHRSGDEFLFRATDPEAVKRVVGRVNEKLKDANFEIQKPDGTTAQVKGIGLSHGTGTDEQSAEISAAADKQARKAAGLRTGARDDSGQSVHPLGASDTEGKQAAQNNNAGRQDLLGEAPASNLDVASMKPGEAGNVDSSSLSLDPKRFQYKLSNIGEGGVTNALKGQKYNPDLAGVIHVWTDPADGKTYIVNGHHRFNLAQESGQPSQLVRKLSAPDAKTARAQGALINIAENRGTAYDAGRFFQDSKLGPDDLKKFGVSMTDSKAADGLALSKLDPSILDKVGSGGITEQRGIAIGQATADPAQQEAILKLIERQENKGRKVTNDTVAELSRFVANSGNKTIEQGGLFGANQEIHSLALDKAELSAYVKQQISKEKRAFGAVSTEDRAKTLGAVEGQSIKASDNAALSASASQHLELYDKLSTTKGPVDDILESVAREKANGYITDQAAKAKAYERIREAIRTLNPGAEVPSGGGSKTRPGFPGPPK